MTISWEAWEKLRSSLDYCWVRMRELDPGASSEDRAEYEALVEQAVATASRLVQLSGPDVPALDTAAARLRWETCCRAAAVLRESIVEHSAALRDALDESDRALAED